MTGAERESALKEDFFRLSMVAHACNPSYPGDISRKIMV
jgi:hypothetical protein